MLILNGYALQLLIANNGMAAFKCVMSIRRWAQETFKDDRLFKFINLTTEQEISSNPGKNTYADFVET